MFEGPVQDLIDELGRLPGVGPKSAQRLAFHILAAEEADITRLQDALAKVKAGVVFCEVCGTGGRVHPVVAVLVRARWARPPRGRMVPP